VRVPVTASALRNASLRRYSALKNETESTLLMNSSIGSSAPSATLGGGGTGEVLPLRVGLIGLDSYGLFHAERLGLRPDLTLVAASDPGAEAGGKKAPRLAGTHAERCRVYSRVEDLLCRDELGTVLIAGPVGERAAWAQKALAAGKDVALDSPPCSDAASLRELLATARRTGRRLSVLPTRRGGADFQTALELVRSERLVSVTSARLLSWGKAVPSESSVVSPSRPETDCDAFAFFAYQYVEQALQLTGGRPRSLFARIVSPPADEPNGVAFTLAIFLAADGKEPASDVLIDVNLCSGVVVQTGWILAGARGGLSGGRIYWSEPTGEICDAPIKQAERPEIDVYAELLLPAHAERGPTASAREAEIVLRVIDAARESARTGQTVGIELES
jgi:predicted dehydrogenase